MNRRVSIRYRPQVNQEKTNMNPKVDFYFAESGKWHKHLLQLRTIVLDCGLNEELKWGVPCYTFQKRNVVLIHTFKEYCALLFVKGALLQDAEGILIQQTANVQSARQVRFVHTQEIVRLAPILKRYILEATEIEKAGLQVPLKKTKDFPVPDELLRRMEDMPELKAAFGALTPGRQRAYLFHFAQPKQSKTREARVEKYLRQILAGKGLND